MFWRSEQFEKYVKEARRGRTIPLTKGEYNYYLLPYQKLYPREGEEGDLVLVLGKRTIAAIFSADYFDYEIAQKLFSWGFELHPSYYRGKTS